MFNLKNHAKKAQMVYERYNRDNELGPKVDEPATIGEKKLPHRDGFEQTIAEDVISDKHKWEESENTQITEKNLESTSGSYTTHRIDSDLSMPNINVFVEQICKKRLAEDYKVTKDPHWSQTFNEKKQQGSLPKWTKNAPQHDKPVLGNDPQRFSASDDPTAVAKQDLTPLVGDITVADINNVAASIKTGKSAEYDNAILAILRLAHDERRELTDVERKTIVNLKVARTNKLLKKC